ncbi:MAG: hypothetical protein AAGI37_15010 [Planctomycetota bacterium]
MNLLDLNPTPEELARIPRTPALLLDKRHAAMALAISEGTLDRLVRAGQLRPIYLGKQLPRFYIADLIEMIDRIRDEQVAQPGVRGGRNLPADASLFAESSGDDAIADEEESRGPTLVGCRTI